MGSIGRVKELIEKKMYFLFFQTEFLKFLAERSQSDGYYSLSYFSFMCLF